jgi:hypothetical protein
MAEKKHEKIRKEIDRMRKADDNHLLINDCSPTDYMRGKANVYTDLLNFINKL